MAGHTPGHPVRDKQRLCIRPKDCGHTATWRNRAEIENGLEDINTKLTMTDVKFHYSSFEASSMAFNASLDILSISPVGCSPPLSSVVFERMFVSCSTSASSITTIFSEARSFSSCAVRSHAMASATGRITGFSEICLPCLDQTRATYRKSRCSGQPPKPVKSRYR